MGIVIIPVSEGLLVNTMDVFIMLNEPKYYNKCFTPFSFVISSCFNYKITFIFLREQCINKLDRCSIFYNKDSEDH